MTEILLELEPWKGSREAEVPEKITKRGSTAEGRLIDNSMNDGCCVGDRAKVLAEIFTSSKCCKRHWPWLNSQSG
jgi:hypothetical protein